MCLRVIGARTLAGDSGGGGDCVNYRRTTPGCYFCSFLSANRCDNCMRTLRVGVDFGFRNNIFTNVYIDSMRIDFCEVTSKVIAARQPFILCCSHIIDARNG